MILIGVLIPMFLAGVVGYGLYRVITVKDAASSPSDYGRKWMAWTVFFFTILWPTLPKFFSSFDVNALMLWLTSVVFFGAVAYVLGWIYGKLFGNKREAIPYSVLTNPAEQDNKSDGWNIGNEGTSSQLSSKVPVFESDSTDRISIKSDNTAKCNNVLYKKALLAIEYRPEVKAAFDSLAGMPIKFKLKFLELLEKNPKGPIEEYLAEVKKEYDSWLNPYDNENLNIALNEARELGPQAEKEFREIVDVLSDSVEPKEIISKIKKKMVTIPNGARETLDVLKGAYHIDSTKLLMNHFGIRYKKGKYLYKGKRYKRFVNAAIAADKDKLDILDAMNSSQREGSDELKRVLRTLPP